MSRAVAVALVLTAAGCPGVRHHATVNAPGNVVLAPPPFENGTPELYVEPTDPGERELYIAPGIVGGPASGRHPSSGDRTGGELGFYVRLAYKETPSSHRDGDVPWPAPGWALNLGWTPLQYTDEAWLGPIHAEVERQWFLASIGAGLAFYPTDPDVGLQATAAFKPYGVRVRYLPDTGWEIAAALQLELPAAITWSR